MTKMMITMKMKQILFLAAEDNDEDEKLKERKDDENDANNANDSIIITGDEYSDIESQGEEEQNENETDKAYESNDDEGKNDSTNEDTSDDDNEDEHEDIEYENGRPKHKNEVTGVKRLQMRFDGKTYESQKASQFIQKKYQ